MAVKTKASRRKKPRKGRKRAPVQRPLTDRQRRFVEEFLIDFCPGAAAVRAGYSSAGVGGMLVQEPKILQAIAVGKAKLSRRVELTQEEVIVGLREQASYIGADSSHAARVRALELLGKAQGMFPDKVDVRHYGKVQHAHSHIRVDELPLELRRQMLAVLDAKEAKQLPPPSQEVVEAVPVVQGETPHGEAS